MMAELRRSDRLQMDETTVPVLAPGTTCHPILHAILRENHPMRVLTCPSHSKDDQNALEATEFPPRDPSRDEESL
jgi:hypothetical protein